MKKILLIEDDPNIRKLVAYNLENAGFKFNTASSGEEAFKVLKEKNSDLIILDIMLPGIDGFEVCRQIKSNTKTKNIPIIMLTARGDEIDKIVGFEIGADDYMVKPFSPRELILRIKSILKRVDKQDKTELEMINFGELTIDISAHRVILDKEEIRLTSKEFDLLVRLIKNRDKVLTREYLLENIWDISSEVTTRTVDTHIKKLRQKLSNYGQYIETLRGVGYRFKESINENKN